jgi:Ca2+-binding RTX toxin-like protein
MYGLGGDDSLYGGEGNDALHGGKGADFMVGGVGNDTYYVDNADDTVIENLNEGTDTVYASVSYTLAAGTSVQYLRANAGSTGLTLTGNELDNTIVGGKGADTMIGGTGNDTFYVDNAGDSVTEKSGEGTDTVYANVNYTLGAGQSIQFLRANAGSTGLTLTGNEFDNTIVGGTGSDTLIGGKGNDTLQGGAGADMLTGGIGADKFTLATLADSTVASPDAILDFSTTALDKIDLHLMDANASLAGDQAFSFVGTSAFAGMAGQLHYAASGGNTLISGDVNGDKTADFSILANGAHTFSASDFVL